MQFSKIFRKWKYWWIYIWIDKILLNLIVLSLNSTFNWIADDKVNLTDEGQELRKMIKDHGKVRQSNVTSEEVEAMRKKAQKSTCKLSHENNNKDLVILKMCKIIAFIWKFIKNLIW